MAVVVDVELNVFGRNVRQLRLQHKLLVGVLIDIDRRGPRTCRHQAFVVSTVSRSATIGIKRTIDAVLQLDEVPKGIETNNGHDPSSWIQERDYNKRRPNANRCSRSIAASRSAEKHLVPRLKQLVDELVEMSRPERSVR